MKLLIVEGGNKVFSSIFIFKKLWTENKVHELNKGGQRGVILIETGWSFSDSKTSKTHKQPGLVPKNYS